MRERGNDYKFTEFQKEHFEEFVTEIINENNKLADATPVIGGCKFVPCRGIELNNKMPYIDNKMIAQFKMSDA